ncbi:hypothetical protein [Microbacterium sp. MMO-10]|uniref:hypothetical protein n=1 Tax=Microbacterium sp. MMO-10 TaxID=3081272 RepID=UPI003017E569
MNLSIVSNVLLILLAVGFVAVRQMTWRPVLGARDWMLPGIIAVIGAVLSLQTLSGQVIGVMDVIALVVELVVAFALGTAMGAMAHIRRIARPAGYQPAAGLSDRAAAQAAAEFETRTGPWGLALWVVLIGVRVGLMFAFEQLGSHIGVATGLILIVLAANRAARVVVLHRRVDALRRTSAPSGSARIIVP